KPHQPLPSVIQKAKHTITLTRRHDPILAKKYTTAVKKTSFIGSDYMELYNAGVLIYLMDPFFFSNTSLFFIRTDVRNKILKNIPTNLLDDELKVLNYLVEKSFQSTK
ncbi:hypothetical protein, partial [Serratia fonticola]